MGRANESRARHAKLLHSDRMQADIEINKTGTKLY